jgi:parallel beta-helix repeat protein
MTFTGDFPIPGFVINKTRGELIENGDEVKFKIIRTEVDPVESCNVIGTIPAEDESVTKTVIIGGHYDSFWGQCTMDNAVSPAIAWGVAKYFSDNSQIKPKYILKFVAFGSEEPGLLGSKSYVKEFIKGIFNRQIAVINLDTLCQNSYKNGKRYPPLIPWIWPRDKYLQDDDPYDKIWNVIDKSDYRDTTNIPITKPTVWNKRNFVNWYSDSWSFFGKAKYHVALERWPIDEDNNLDTLAYYDHRSGEDFQKGDVLNKVYTTDLYETAELVLDLVKLFAVDGNLVFQNDCSYTQLDLDSDGNYDSVKIDFDVISNYSASGMIQSVIYQNGVAQTTPFKTDLFSTEQNVTSSGNLTVTLLSNATAGNCDIRVYLKDCNGSQDDFDNTTLYLYPYNHSIADFTWELNNNSLKMINFTDKSMSSPNTVLNSWNWSFGDGNYSNQQNCSHNYSDVGLFNVTLTVTDTANKSANVTKQIETYNSDPSASFTINSTIIMVNNSLTFNSTSSDIDGSIMNSTWYFGDNTTGYDPNITHTYNKSGLYTVSLEITDNDNTSSGVTKKQCVLVVDALVDDGFTDNPNKHKWNSIQEGINDVNDNDTIYVYNGSYNPYLVNKSISIYGESKDDVRLLLSPLDIGIDIQSHDVIVKNFTIDGGTTGVKITSTVNGTGNITIENGIIPGPVTYGVYIDNSSNNTVKNCEIEKADAGVKICNGAMYNVIDDCDFEGCYNGVGIYNSDFNWVGKPSIYDWYPNDCIFKLNTNAIYLDESDHNYILGCDIDADSPLPFGTYRGIYLDESDYTTISTCDIYKGTQGVYIKDSVDSKIEFCRIRENENGVEFYGLDAKDNLIVQNNVTGNTQFGIFIPAEPSNNSIYYNDFIGNTNPGPATNQSHDDRSSGQMNIWEKTGGSTLTKNGNGEGNYWDDYTGSDLDSDGIGDTPYELDTISDRVVKDDDYPLMAAYGWCTGTGWD